MNCINEQQQQQVSVETNNTAPVMMSKAVPISPKASDFLYGSKGLISRTTPDVLNKMMSTTSATFSVRSAFLQDCERRRKINGVTFEPKGVSFEAEEKKDPEAIDYGYGEDFVPPPPKKRRMERRNSKTPRMLMAMNASLASLDFLNDTDDLFKTETTGNDEFDSGLHIAEDLVKHLQSRRRRTALKL